MQKAVPTAPSKSGTSFHRGGAILLSASQRIVRPVRTAKLQVLPSICRGFSTAGSVGLSSLGGRSTANQPASTAVTSWRVTSNLRLPPSHLAFAISSSSSSHKDELIRNQSFHAHSRSIKFSCPIKNTWKKITVFYIDTEKHI